MKADKKKSEENEYKCVLKSFRLPLFYFQVIILPVLLLLLLRTVSLHDRYLSTSPRENIVSQAIWLHLLYGSVNIPRTPRQC